MAGYVGVVAVLLSSCAGESPTTPESRQPLGVVLMIGDGMGDEAVEAARLTAGSLHMELLPVRGAVRTENAADEITDSGASATAYATGTSTYNGAIGMGPDSLPRPNILELAESLGMATGVVATSSVTHATPAAFLAHVVNRASQEEIARQAVWSGVDVVLGGGLQYFDRDSRTDDEDLIFNLRLQGYSVLTGPADLAATPPGDSTRAYGFFADDGMPVADSRAPSLSEMTAFALQVMQRDPDGFVLVVEGSQIDWAAHANDSARLVDEMLDFDDAVRTVARLVNGRPNTLLVVTADHETGGLAVEPDTLTGAIAFRWATTGHTASPVPLFAAGNGADAFADTLPNARVGQLLQQVVVERSTIP